ncbi:MAG TPA: glycosyltransferase [Frateuria sp.]|uniref:glycosyltransferase n=1 Tax=Frateuria sp. TaxID=2211372 RepID=UPI002DE39E57|nr:glycosyltransferase [Frateuria sp.]
MSTAKTISDMTQTPLVSIALATFNGGKYLEKQLESLIGQDYPNFEIVASDDGSADTTQEILQRYALQDRRIRLLPPHKNIGIIQNFALCFSECRGDVISPCDQDDVWYPGKTRRLVEAMGDALLVYCNSQLIDDRGRPTGRTLADTLNMLEGNDPRPFLFSNSVLGHAMMFRKHILSNHGALTRVPHDWWLAFVASNLGHITYVDEVLVDYRRHGASVTKEASTSKTSAQRKKFLNEDFRRLRAMAEFPGDYQSYAQSIRNAWLAWRKSYLDLSMFRAVLRDGEITHKAFLKEKSRFQLALKYVAGHRLKHLLRPNYYPS